MYYQTIAWQTAETVATNDADSSPATGIESTITAQINSQTQPYPTEETAVSGTYSRQLASYEITGVNQITVAWLTTTAGVTLTPISSTLTLIDPATLSNQIQYCTVCQLYQYFGSDNVNKWADKNNHKITEEIAPVIIDAIATASSRINALMRDKYYEIPFYPAPYEIMHACRLMAGYELHAARGIEDDDATIQAAAKEAKMIIKQILAGQILFDLPTAQRSV